MQSVAFNLRVRTIYSVLGGLLDVEDVFKLAKANGHDKVGIIDIESMAAMVQAEQMAKKYEIDVYFGFEKQTEEMGQFIVIPLTQTGLRQATQIFNAPINQIDHLDQITQFNSEVAVIVFDDTPAYAVRTLLTTMGEQTYWASTIDDSTLPEWHPLLQCQKIAAKDIRTASTDHLVYIDLISAMKDQKPELPYLTHYLTTEEIESTYTAAELSGLRKLAAQKRKYSVYSPTPKIPVVSTAEFNLTSVTTDNLRKFYEAGKVPADQLSVYEARLAMEIEQIKKNQYEDYFLIVHDLINWGRQQNIPIGPGRGSCVGSIVAWLLRISEIDPIKYNLIFERFLNPGRKDYPDIDVDVCQNRRHEIISYVAEKYGIKSVAQMGVFGQMHFKSAFKDLARQTKSKLVFSELNAVLKAYDNEEAILTYVTKTQQAIDCANNENELRQQVALLYQRQLATADTDDPDQLENDALKDLRIYYTNKLESLKTLAIHTKHISKCFKSKGVHPSGVIISNVDLTEWVPIKLHEGGACVEMEMDDIVALGLIKFDILLLTAITILFKMAELHGESLYEIPLDQPMPYSAIASRDCTGIFQVDKNHIKTKMQQVRQLDFDKLVDLIALNRPGVVVRMDDYVEAKNTNEHLATFVSNEKVKQLDYSILRPTGGVFIFQEQIIQFLTGLGLTASDADLIRRAIAKKKPIPPELTAQYEKVISNLNENEKKELISVIESGYAFNKSHSVPYTLMTYLTAYFKAKDHLNFALALAEQEMGENIRLKLHLAEIVANHFGFWLPNTFNQSTPTYLGVQNFYGKTYYSRLNYENSPNLQRRPWYIRRLPTFIFEGQGKAVNEALDLIATKPTLSQVLAHLPADQIKRLAKMGYFNVAPDEANNWLQIKKIGLGLMRSTYDMVLPTTNRELPYDELLYKLNAPILAHLLFKRSNTKTITILQPEKAKVYNWKTGLIEYVNFRQPEYKIAKLAQELDVLVTFYPTKTTINITQELRQNAGKFYVEKLKLVLIDTADTYYSYWPRAIAEFLIPQPGLYVSSYLENESIYLVNLIAKMKELADTKCLNKFSQLAHEFAAAIPATVSTLKLTHIDLKMMLVELLKAEK